MSDVVGVVDTKLLRKSYDMQGITIEEGAKTSVMLAASLDVGEINGKYFQNEKEKAPSSLSTDEKLQEEFWQISLDLLSNYLN